MTEGKGRGRRPRALQSRLAALAAPALLLAGCASRPAQPIGSFGDFEPPSDRAHYLACPEDYCLARPDELTPLYRIPAERLRTLVRRAIDAEPRTVLIGSANEGLRLVYRQRSGLFGLVADTVTIDVIDADVGESGIAIYSQSDDRTLDLGANRDRVRRWLREIRAEIAADRGASAAR